MKKLLHIIATPRGEESSTLKIGTAVEARFKELHPDSTIERLDLFAESLPPMTVKAAEGKYRLLSGKELDGETQKAWEPIIAQIKRFQEADFVLISSPMWNFGMPYVLKHYIDVIAQPRYLFRYTETGPVGLAHARKAVVVTSRGGDYSEGPGAAMDHLMPSLKTVLGFIGIPEVTFINAQPMMAMGPEVASQKVTEAIAKARSLSF